MRIPLFGEVENYGCEKEDGEGRQICWQDQSQGEEEEVISELLNPGNAVGAKRLGGVFISNGRFPPPLRRNSPRLPRFGRPTRLQDRCCNHLETRVRDCRAPHVSK
ncbi:MAG: hypothetical protein A4S17_07515 [Proteobacteria bacterium HN_bin10]|nr:MAG: hypothetical protein A4S17_07515 [Proteobacteria bacterium HN_bin10]